MRLSLSKLTTTAFFTLIGFFGAIHNVEASTVILQEVASPFNSTTQAIGTTTGSGTVQSVYGFLAVSTFGGMTSTTPWHIGLTGGVSGQTNIDCVSTSTTAEAENLIVTGDTGTNALPSLRKFAINVFGSECTFSAGDKVGMKIRRDSNLSDVTRTDFGTTTLGYRGATMGFFTGNEAFDYLYTPDTSSSTPTVPIPANITIVEPAYGATTATTTFNVAVNFKTAFSFDFRPTTTRHFEIVDALTNAVQYSYSQTVPTNTGENLQINQSVTVPEGSKYIRAMYLDQNGGIYSEVAESFFNVATNTFYASTGLLTPTSPTNELTQIDCDTFDVGCQFQKAVTYLFYPDQNVLDKFRNLWQTIAEKKPFGYVTHTISQLSQLSTSGSGAFDLGTVPFMDSIFSPFRTLMASILWALFAIFFYKNRLIHLDI